MHKCPFLAAAAVPAAPSVGMVAAGHSNYSFRNNRLFERNPTTWVPQAPMRNGKKEEVLRRLNELRVET